MEARELTKEEALKVLRLAKRKFIEDWHNGFGDIYNVGMCGYIYTAILYFHIKGEWILYEMISDFIPNFNPIFLGGEEGKAYWWPREDLESRIKAFNKLIKYYEEL